ncbi:MAG: oxidoreductase [Polyangiales bacterium]
MSKVWFITGASSGFGRALAEEVLARGDRIVAAVRKLDAVRDLVDRAPDRVHALQLDVTQSEQIAAAVRGAYERFGVIDVLVNNAGYTLLGALEETSEGELRSLMDTLFFGPALLTRAVLPQLRERGAGTIVQISSSAGIATWAGSAAYCAAKHALEGLSESLAKEVAPFGVRVLIVEPGMFRTQLLGAGFRRMPPLDVYASSVGPVRAFVADNAGQQPGDPHKAARAIYDAVAAGAPHLRLPLGADAISGIRDKLAEVQADVAANEAVAQAMALTASGR